MLSATEGARQRPPLTTSQAANVPRRLRAKRPPRPSPLRSRGRAEASKSLRLAPETKGGAGRRRGLRRRPGLPKARADLQVKSDRVLQKTVGPQVRHPASRLPGYQPRFQTTSSSLPVTNCQSPYPRTKDPPALQWRQPIRLPATPAVMRTCALVRQSLPGCLPGSAAGRRRPFTLAAHFLPDA